MKTKQILELIKSKSGSLGRLIKPINHIVRQIKKYKKYHKKPILGKTECDITIESKIIK